MFKRLIQIAIVMALMALACAAAETLTLPTDLTEIEAEAFMGDASITDVILPEGLTTIGSMAFARTGLREVLIPASVTDIAGNAFTDCEQLTTVRGYADTAAEEWARNRGLDFIDLAGRFETVENDDGTLSIARYSGRSTILVIPAVIDGRTISSIGDSAFAEHESLRSVVIPDGVTFIGEGAFYKCDHLSSVRLPEGLESIESYAFYCCDSLTEIDVPGSVGLIDYVAFRDCTALKRVGFGNGIQVIGNKSFMGCTGLTEVDIPGSVEEIDYSAFSGCKNLSTVTLSEGVQIIGSDSFGSCSALKRIALPATLKKLDLEAFAGCTDLADIDVASGNVNFASVNGMVFNADKTELLLCPMGKQGAVSVPDGVIRIHNYAFSYCDKLTRIDVPESVVEMENAGFTSCASLTGIHVSAGNTAWCSVNGVLFDRALEKLIAYPCATAGDYVIPDGVVSIGDQAFYQCAGLTGITIPDSVGEIIGFNTFQNCTALTHVTIPGSINDIPSRCFQGCTGLTDVVIEEGVDRINRAAFSGCTALVNVTIAESVSQISTSSTTVDGVRVYRDQVFVDCPGLTAIHGVSGSFAETWAERVGFAFIADE